MTPNLECRFRNSIRLSTDYLGFDEIKDAKYAEKVPF